PRDDCAAGPIAGDLDTRLLIRAESIGKAGRPDRDAIRLPHDGPVCSDSLSVDVVLQEAIVQPRHDRPTSTIGCNGWKALSHMLAREIRGDSDVQAVHIPNGSATGVETLHINVEDEGGGTIVLPGEDGTAGPVRRRRSVVLAPGSRRHGK